MTKTKSPIAFWAAHRAGLLSLFALIAAPSCTESAVANGDTRTIYLYHAHTHESIAATFRVNGQYDPEVLKQLNWFLRDWRRDEPTTMDPRLFDTVWEVYRSAGAGNSPINVVSAYRSPETNAMLRRRSRAVAEHSQHMLGKAMDTTMPGMSMSQIRELGMRLQHGGVGYYPTAGTPFVHLDVGSVRSWPRMSYDQLVRLFPDGKTVHLPSNGQPLARYEEARAEIAANGGGYSVPPSSKSTGFLAWLFGGSGGAGGEDDDEGAAAAPLPHNRVADVRRARGKTQVASLAPPQQGAPVTAGSGGFDDSGRNFFATDAYRGGSQSAPPIAQPAPVARAESNLPRGETYLAPAAPQPQQAAAAPQQVAALDNSVELASAEANDSPVVVNMPLPPRRPGDLAALADVPMPPVRPAELAALNAAPRALATSVTAYTGGDVGLRRDPIADVIQGVSDQGLRDPGRAAAPPRPALRANVASLSPQGSAPAGLTPPLPALRSGAAKALAAPTAIVPARLDQSNFRAMSGREPAARMTTQSVRGPTFIAARAAMRGEAALLSPAATGGANSGFGASATELPTAAFEPSRQRRAAIGAVSAQ